MNLEAIFYLALAFGLPTLGAVAIFVMAHRDTKGLEATLRRVGYYKK